MDKAFDDSRIVHGERQDGHIKGVGEGAGERQLATIMGLLGEGEVFGSQRLAALEVVVHQVVEQQPVHSGGYT